VPTGTYRYLQVGESCSCAVESDGDMSCWGYSIGGECYPPAGDFLSLDLGNIHACDVRVDGQVRCWGNNQYGQLNPYRSFLPSIMK